MHSDATFIMPLSEDLKREIGQHFVLGFHGFDLNDEIKSLINDYHVGCIILMKRNVKDVNQVRKLVYDLQRFAKECGHLHPLLIGTDQENGLVSAFSSPTAGTQFPGAMALAASGSPELVEEVYAASAKELRSVGINWAYSPVADVNSDPRNPVIGVRSFGDNPSQVGRYAVAAHKGLTSSNVASCAKHFPGHGDTHVDSHLALPCILKSKEDIFKTEIIPFQQLIQTGVASIMTGHMALPLITGDNTPCSLSRKITFDLLREELRYTGTVVTDCLEMDAIADEKQGGCGVVEAATRALGAGADIVMICHTFNHQVAAITNVYRALEDGRLDREALLSSGKRIVHMKSLFVGTWEGLQDVGSSWDSLKSANADLARRAYAQSTAIVWNHNSILPLSTLAFQKSRIALFLPARETLNKAIDESDDGVLKTPEGVIRNTAGSSYQGLSFSLSKLGVEHRTILYTSESKPVDEVELEGASAVMFVMRNSNRSPWQVEHLKKVLQAIESGSSNLVQGRIPVILLSSCEPYDLMESNGLDLSATAYVATFEFTFPALEAAVDTIFSQSDTKGRVLVPVHM